LAQIENRVRPHHCSRGFAIGGEGVTSRYGVTLTTHDTEDEMMPVYFEGASEVNGQHTGSFPSLPAITVSASRSYWQLAQYIVLVAGIALVAALLFLPKVGLLIMWNVLIPIAPALIVVAPGLWRNICPMATLSLLPRGLGFSRQKILARRTAALLGASGLLALLLIVPLRHVVLNTNGPMTALMLLLSAGVAIATGLAFEWRSGWCNTLCPIHPVEKLYGQSPAIKVRNRRCDTCKKCVTPCPDSTRSMNPSITGPTPLEKWAGHIMIGCFVGFIWGWYRLPDYHGNVGSARIMAAYLWPYAGALVSFAIYFAVRTWACRTKEDRAALVKVFAAAAVSTYYWYRIPALAGFGPHPGTGQLCDLTAVLPGLPLISHILTTVFFVWFLLIRGNSGTGWMVRLPAAAN
jgi:Fe-S-cluster-containing hydrogenase component 2